MSNVIEFRPATRHQLFSRTCLYGVGGSGKTLTMLLMLRELVGPDGKFAVVDTERGKSRKYLGLFKTPEHPDGLQFGIITPTSFHPESLTQAVSAAAAQGFDGLGVDSGSHYWDGADGMQEQVDRITANAGRGDKFGSGWKEMGPVERRMWDAVTGAPMHVVMTLRTKADYVVEEKENSRGRMSATPKKIGLRPRQRDGFEYEFDIVGQLDLEHVLTIVKSDVMVIPVGAEYEKPGAEFAQLIGDFCKEGEEAAGPMQYRARLLDPALTLPGSKELLDEIVLMGFDTTPVLDEHDRVVTLRDLVLQRANAIKAADDAAARQRAQQAAAAPAPGSDPAPAAESAATTERHGTMGPAERAKRLDDAVRSLLTAADVDQAGKRQERADRSPLATVEVDGLLTDDDRQALDVHREEPVTLSHLAALVCDYVGLNKRSVRNPLEADMPGEATARAEQQRDVA